MKRIKETAGRTMQAAGIMTAMLGAASMDSQDMRYPVAILAAGVFLLWTGCHVSPIVPDEYYEVDGDDEF